MAQDSTRYGLDHGVRDGLAYLLRRLGRVDGLRWIRVMYAYPSTLTDPILDAIAVGGEGRQVRGHPAAARERARPQADEAAHRARQPARDGRADPRAGARAWPSGPRSSWASRARPTEDFEQPARVRRRPAEFDNVGVFTFSDEEGTTSFDLPGRVPARVKEARRRKLMALQKRISARQEPGARGRAGRGAGRGHPPRHRPAAPGPARRPRPPRSTARSSSTTATAAPGSFVTCEVTEAHPYDLVGRISSGVRSGMLPGRRVGRACERRRIPHGVMRPFVVAGPIGPRTS